MKQEAVCMDEAKLENGMEEELDNIIVLNDEDGNEVPFEFLDLVEYQEREFVVLLPAEGEDTDTVVILELVEEDDDMESYLPVEDEDLLNAIFDIFKEKFSDQFDFEE